MKTELMYLLWTTLLTAVLWMPYIVDRILVLGITEAVGYPQQPKPQSPWAQRLMKAHANAVENLVIFATLVLLAHAAGVSNGVTASACAVYFWARLAHAVAFTLAIPWVRTFSFIIAFGAQMAIAWQLLAR